MKIILETQEKIQVIARKMAKLGYGVEEELFQELLNRYVQVQAAKLINITNERRKK